MRYPTRRYIRSSALSVSPLILRAGCELAVTMRYLAATDRGDMFNWGGLLRAAVVMELMALVCNA